MTFTIFALLCSSAALSVLYVYVPGVWSSGFSTYLRSQMGTTQWRFGGEANDKSDELSQTSSPSIVFVQPQTIERLPESENWTFSCSAKCSPAHQNWAFTPQTKLQALLIWSMKHYSQRKFCQIWMSRPPTQTWSPHAQT